MTDRAAPRPHPVLPRLLRAVGPPLFALVVSFGLGGLLMAVLGKNPFTVYAVLLVGSLSGWPNLAVTLQLTTPLIFTGLAVAIAFRSGIWNIGVEGQMLMGALAAGIVGYAAPLPDWAMVPACLLAALAGGAAWAAIPALLRAYIGVNELVLCLMLNPIALLLTGYVSARVLKAPGPTNKLPDVVDAARLANFSLYSQLNTGIFIALACCALMALFNNGTVRGFEWKLIGLNARFANYGGIRVRRNVIGVMLVSGAIGGLAGAEQVLGVYGAFYDNFSPGYGFDGIAVAMLANSSPIGVLFSAFLFGALNSGSSVLQMELGISKYLVQVLQFIVVLILAARFTFSWRGWRRPLVASAPAVTLPMTLPAEQGTTEA
ncbi:ABC transporter permease [Lichenifustis flavocetrariae]|uniref:ABC transporter permease n=1 Tax=Lichenifustis flavocetrariae TaxID=2949735 RepID=A0AA41YXX6_9HYPH|nr:ABC transporter permease [Lichenifustis flavocetrariae]MCW6510604.1 ABC transporter permease [Lichenifustis flavocetrariae]